MKILGTIQKPRRTILIYQIYDVFIAEHPPGEREEAIKLFEEELLNDPVDPLPKYDLILFGKPFSVLEREGPPRCSLLSDKIVIWGRGKLDRLKVLEKVLKEKLIEEASKILESFKGEGIKLPKRLEAFKSTRTIALCSPRSLKLSLFSLSIPKESLRVLLAHELSHLYSPRHDELFFRTFLRMAPEAFEVESPIDAFKKYFAMSLSSLEIACEGALRFYV